MSKRTHYKHKKAAAQPVRTLGCMIKFPERVWEQGFMGGWVSRPATEADRESRKDVARMLGATIQVGA